MGSKLSNILLQIKRRWRFQITCTRAAHTEAESRLLASDLAEILGEKLSSEPPTQPDNNDAFIYRVPRLLRSVEPKAYEPNIVSIGPLHHGAQRLQAMENTKWNFFRSLFSPNKPGRRSNLREVVSELEAMEQKARGCYSENIKLSSKKFVNMMVIDSSFIIQLLRETKGIDFNKSSVLIKRWMLPVLQRDLIMLENQLPLFVLNKVYDLTSISTCNGTEDLGLKELALQFFEPMIYKDLDNPKNSSLGTGDGGSHFLDLFRASICPTEVSEKEFPVKEPHMFRSVAELKEYAGVKFRKAENRQPLDVSFEFRKGVLKIPPMSMDDHKFTLFRNMVALEQCHFACKPYVTAYIFFLDRLINSAKDIELLHYAGVMQHSLGGNTQAAKLVNKLCKEVAGAVDDSYLRDVLWKINSYCNDGWNQKRAKLKHKYFYNVWVSLSSLAAVVLIYLAILQTGWGLGDHDARAHMSRTGFWIAFAEAFTIPLRGVRQSKDKSTPVKDIVQIDECFQWFLTRSI